VNISETRIAKFIRHPYDLLLLLLLGIPLFFTGVRDIHGWGDDYAQYIKEGQNIAAGEAYYRSGYIFNPHNPEYAPPSYPPGFPLLLAPVIKFSGLSIRPMLYLISFMLMIFLLCSYYFYQRHMSRVSAFCLALIGTYCGAVMDLKPHVLADIPLLTFTSLYFLLRIEKPSSGRILLLSLTALMSILIRTQGALLLAAELLLLITTTIRQLKKREFHGKVFLKNPSLIIVASTLISHQLVSLTVFRAPHQPYSFYGNLFSLYDHNAWAMLAYNLNYLVDLLRTLLHYVPEDFFWQALVTIIEYVSFGFAFAGFLFSLRRMPELETYFFLLMCLLIFVLPVHQGARYLLPVLPVYLLYFFRGAKIVMPVLTTNVRSATLLFTILFLMLGYSHVQAFKEPLASHPYNRQDSLAFRYIRENVKDDEIIVFAKPRALNLYTGKRSVNLAWQKTPAQNKQFFDSLEVTYLLKRNALEDEYITQYLAGTAVPSDTIIINDEYVMYRVK